MNTRVLLPKELNAYTLLETILAIAEAQRDGVTVAGQIGDIRFNSTDPLSPVDVVKMARTAMFELQGIQVAYDILEKKVKPLHCKPSLSEEKYDARENLWSEVHNRTRFTPK